MSPITESDERLIAAAAPSPAFERIFSACGISALLARTAIRSGNADDQHAKFLELVELVAKVKR